MSPPPLSPISLSLSRFASRDFTIGAHFAKEINESRMRIANARARDKRRLTLETLRKIRRTDDSSGELADERGGTSAAIEKRKLKHAIVV